MRLLLYLKTGLNYTCSGGVRSASLYWYLLVTSLRLSGLHMPSWINGANLIALEFYGAKVSSLRDYFPGTRKLSGEISYLDRDSEFSH